MNIESTTLVFDLDGTLTDPSLGICRCFNFALEMHSFESVPFDSIVSEIGPPLDETFHKLAPSASVSDVRAFVETYRERYAKIGYSENQIYPGISDAVAELSKAGLRLGVCTSKRQDFAKKILALFDLLSYFEFVDGGDIGIKKSEQLFDLIETGRIDQRATMIGDRNVDIQSAKSNQLRSIGVLWGFGSRTELADAGPDYTVGDIGELVNIFI